MLVQLSGYAELELILMLFGAIAITVMLISQRCPTLGVQRYNGGLSDVCWRSVVGKPARIPKGSRE